MMLRGLGLGMLLGIGIGGVAWAQGPTWFDGNYVVVREEWLTG
jgi:hypothetical protein